VAHWVLQFTRSPAGEQQHEAVAALPGGGALVLSRRKNTSGTSRFPNLFAVNVNGTVAWAQQLYSPATPELQLYGAVATSANWLVAATMGFGSPTGTVIQALDAATHTVQWYKRLDIAITGNSRKLAVDASGNVYVMGQKLTGATETVLIKFNSSGVQQW
jgi:outer membrane protein assembly factor BamB